MKCCLQIVHEVNESWIAIEYLACSKFVDKDVFKVKMLLPLC